MHDFYPKHRLNGLKIRLNFCFDMKTQTNLTVGAWVKVGHVQCLKSQTFSNSCAKNRHDILQKLKGKSMIWL